MAYDRYETRRNRWRDNDDRGFFEKAGDEISSWFGGDDRDRRRDEMASRERGWERDGNWDRNRDWDNDRERYAIGGWGERESERAYGADRNNRDRYEYGRYGRDWDNDRERWSDEQRSSQPMNWTSSNRAYTRGGGGYDRDYTMRGREGDRSSGWGDYERDFGRRDNYDRDNRERAYRSGASAYGYGYGRGGYDRSETAWGRDDYRNTSYAGSARDNDRHYDAWRQRQLNDLDRDYEMYCRERQDRFENDFGTWRQERQAKRQHLGGIQEHMDVVGSDGETVGKVDKVRGDRIILTKSDSEDNRHHSFDCSLIDTVEGDQVRLQVPAEEAKSRFDQDEGGFISSGPDHEGPNLERSFSGTYTR